MEQYFYFPTSSKKIVFERGKIYVCLTSNCSIYGIKKNHTYKVLDFKTGDLMSPIILEDENKKMHRITPFDCGSFCSLKELRRKKLKKLNLSL